MTINLILLDSTSVIMPCTIGAKRIGNRFLLFKNRDLIYPDFKDNLIFDNSVFAITGIKIGTGEPAGFSLGLNHYGLAACNANVLATEDIAYDVLLEKIIREADNIDKAYKIVNDAIQRGERYQWTNFILATPDEVAAIEIGYDICELEKDPTQMLRTNHHLKLPTIEIVKNASVEQREAGGKWPASRTRRQKAAGILQSAKTLGDIIDLLSSHSESRGYDSICRHRKDEPKSDPFHGETVYSYILEVDWEESERVDFRIYVARGNPCSNAFKEFQIDFDASPSSKIDLIHTFP